MIAWKKIIKKLQCFYRFLIEGKGIREWTLKKSKQLLFSLEAIITLKFKASKLPKNSEIPKIQNSNA